MRFVWAVLAFVLATLLIGAGIAQRTIFQGPSEATETLDVPQDAPFILLDADVLRTHPGAQTLTVSGDGDIFAAYANEADMTAWIQGVSYNEIGLDDGGDAQVTYHAAEATETQVAHTPAGSDLWLDEFTQMGELVVDDVQIPEGVTMLIATDGSAPAPRDIQISWTLDTSTPWVGPLIVGGVILLLVGIVLYFLGIRHQRRGRGPRRKGPGPLPVTEPISLEAARREELTTSEAPATDDTAEAAPEGRPPAGKTERRRLPRPARIRRLLLLPAAVVSVALVTGCSSESWPDFSAETPTPTPTPTLVAPENQKPPAVTEDQATRILTNISATVAQADTEMNIDLAATRLDGAVLDARRTEYALRTALPDRAAPAVIPTENIEVLLPQQTDTWPRTVLILSQSDSDETVPPVIMTMVQADPWSSYKVTELAEMQASAEVPSLAPAWAGTTLVTEGAAAFMEVPPANLADAFADVVDAGEQSTYYGLFDDAALQFAQAIRDSRAQVVQGLKDAGAEETSETAFDLTASSYSPVALATLDSGALVATSVTETQTVTPTVDDAAILYGEGNPEAKALTGAEKAEKGVTTTYGMQVFFSVPAQGSNEKIHLLAWHQDLLSVEVIQ